MTTQAVLQENAFVHPANFVECLQHLVATRPEDTALIVVTARDNEIAEAGFTYRAFGLHVQALAAVLQGRFEKGDRVLLLLDNDEHYAVSMFACFHAGVIAVPVFPPESTRPQHLARLAGIAADAQARGILTVSTLRTLVEAAASQFGASEVVAVDEVDAAAAGDWQAHRPASEDVAFLQYTSGSTSAPKAVMVTHGNLMANERAIREGLSIGADDKFGVWSPLFHDMGLIGGLLQPFYSGIPCVLSSPRFFLERPVRWLEMISRHRVTISGGPDFAYRLCLDRIRDAQIEGLDLSSWRVAYTGAEPVRHDTMDAFVARFTAAGFNAGAVYPCYGLAEATLFVTGGRRGDGLVVGRFDSETLAKRREAIEGDGAPLVGCGHVPSDHGIRIVDPQIGETVAAGAVGEIWASGPSIAAGYWNKPRESAETFVERDGCRWLRTGDLGFVHGGQLFVAGRLKDMIIVRGHNLYPQDLERAIEGQVEAVRAGRVAAFAVDGPEGEGIGVAAEVSRGMQKLVTPERLAEALSAAVGETCGEPLSVVLLLNPGGLPKTTSGKLQRQACRSGWQDGSLDTYAVIVPGQGACARTTPSTPVAAADASLAAMWCEVLRINAAQAPAPDAHFFASGGTSLAAADLAARIASRWRIDFSPADVFAEPCFAALGRIIDTRQQAAAAPVAEAVVPVLSHAQQRQWFLWRLDPTSTVHHVSGLLHLAGPVDPARWRSRFSAVLARHATLRTVFRPNDQGLADPVVQADAPLDLVEVDLRAVEAASLRTRMADEAARLNNRPFDLTAGPLLRVALLHLPDGEQALVVVMHHIVADGVSMQVLVGELAATDLAPLPVTYAAHAARQRAALAAGEGERQLAWWCEALGADSPVLELPTDHPRPAKAIYTAAQHSVDLPAAWGSDLRRVAATHGTTPFAVFLAAFQAVLFRYSGQHDIRVGAPIANRGAADVRGLIGLFVNTVVLRNVVHGRLPLSAVLAQAAAAVQGAMAHPDLPFEHLVEALRPERSLTHNPLVQVTINHVTEDFRAFEQGFGTRLVAHEVLRDTVQFDLTLEIHEASDGALRVDFVYAREIFEPDTMRALAGHWCAVLRAFAETPALPLADVPLLDEGERARLTQWSAGPSAPATGRGVHAFVEQFARETPGAAALMHGDRVLTYAELNRRANLLAHRLIALGIGPDRRVGIAMERSIDMIVCLLATMKAGGAYVPLDPAYPTERLDHMMRDSGIGLLLCESVVRARLPVLPGLLAIDVDVQPVAGGRDEPSAEHNPVVDRHPDNLAYVIYTSGSTGLPKGVAVAQGPLASHLAAIAEVYAVTPSHRELLFFSLSFDAAVEQWMTPLCGGGAIVLCDRWELAADRFVDVVLRHGVTTLHMPPAYLRVVAPLFAARPTSVRTCIVGGEAFSRADQALVQAAFRAPRVVNAYGPTETIITPTAWVGEARAPGVSGGVPIGTPVGARCVHVLDPELNLVPCGVIGELYVGGYEIARGYAGRPGLTGERFVADPFSSSGGRLYRTGDRVRWHRDGHLEYFGRADQQVKVRGFRIELGEIEAQLLSQPGVREGAVLVSGEDESARLVAYACPAPGATLDAEALRSALKTQLPDYMVPHAVVLLPALPLTPNGKVDRGALPRPAFADLAGGAAPVGELEAAIAAIWGEALEVPHVGRHDNFFDLGGHSLLLIQVHRRLTEQLGLSLSLVDLFQHATVGALAARAAEGAAVAAPSDGAVLARAQRQRRHFLPQRSTLANRAAQ